MDRLASPKGVDRALIAKITRLHGDITALGRTSLKKALQLGELLTGVKESLPHREWLPWIKNNLQQIAERTAQNYMRIWKNRERIKSASKCGFAINYTDALAMVCERRKKEAELSSTTAPKVPSEQSRKREVIRRLSDVLTDGLETEDPELLDLFLLRLPEFRARFIHELREELEA